jgi:coenzyme F420-dependent glucose-6-phosphate dehydrogenase
MATIGYHASHEQFPPGYLLKCVKVAEGAGFKAAMCSDHFHPWSESQGESGFAWSWLGAAMHATSLPFGVVCAPGQRYHPAIVAQAAATLAEMFEGRFWVALGSGQALNEHITGDRWPHKPDRNARLKESVEIIRSLWSGETVTYRGQHVQVEDARLYTLPQCPPQIIAAAITPETAKWAGEWADGLITINQVEDKLCKVVNAFREGGGEGKPMFVQVQLSFAETDGAARDAAFDQWRMNILPSPILADLRMPEQFDAAAEFVRPDDLEGHILISSDPMQHADWLQQIVEMGFEHLYLHNIHPDQETFADVFGRRVIPELGG